jgi:hypothetical protein
MPKFSRCESYAVSSFSFLRVAWRYTQSLVHHGAWTPSESKIGTEVEGTLTHADAPHRGNSPHSAPRAFVMLYNRFTYEIILCVTHAGQYRVRDQIRVTLKTPLLLILPFTFETYMNKQKQPAIRWVRHEGSFSTLVMICALQEGHTMSWGLAPTRTPCRMNVCSTGTITGTGTGTVWITVVDCWCGLYGGGSETNILIDDL